jgi:DNA polymerase-3 subunit epsilon
VKPPFKLALATAVLTLFTAAAAVAMVAGVWSGADPDARDVLMRLLREQAVFLVVAGMLVVAGFAALAGFFFGRYVFPLRRMAAETRLVASANRQHRLDESGPAESRELAAAVNELAAGYAAAESEVAGRVAAAAAELGQERNRLAALMAELSVPVLVCNAEGRILLYNAAARDLLGELVGLGRSVFGVVDRNVVTHALDRVAAGAPTASAVTSAGNRLLRLQLTAVAGADGGFVATLEDLTGRAVAGERRDVLLRALTEGSRSALAGIRAAIENVLDFPDMDTEQRRRFAEIVRDEAARLGEQVEQAVTESSAYLTDRSLLDEALATDLLAAAAATARTEHRVDVTVSAPGEDAWLQVDGHGVVRAVADLVGLLRAGHDVDAVRLEVTPAERYAALDLRWTGDPVTARDVRRWAERPAVREALTRHGTEAWSGREGGEAYIRLLLPRADEPRTVPRRPRPVADLGSRPPFYDFDLFRASPAAPSWDDRALRDLAYTVFDTETTGLYPNEGDEIVSIGAVRVVNGRVLRQETYEQLVDPGRDISPASYAVHGISAAMVRGQPTVELALQAFARFAEDTVLVGHDVAFDLQFVALKEKAAGVRLTQPALDTLLLDAVVHPDHTEHSLEVLAARLGVDVVGRHTALGDALVTAEVFVRLVPLLERHGLRTLGDVRRAAKATLQARRSEQLYRPAR